MGGGGVPVFMTTVATLSSRAQRVCRNLFVHRPKLSVTSSSIRSLFHFHLAHPVLILVFTITHTCPLSARVVSTSRASSTGTVTGISPPLHLFQSGSLSMTSLNRDVGGETDVLLASLRWLETLGGSGAISSGCLCGGDRHDQDGVGFAGGGGCCCCSHRHRRGERTLSVRQAV